MSSPDVSERRAEVSAENIGGIDRTSVTLSAGINVLAGRNATNRTSFLQAIMAALGSTNVSLKSDVDEGYAEVTIEGETYTRTLQRRENGRIEYGGDPYLDEAESADLFAFLLESSEARQAIVNGSDLREIIMRPIDTDAIQQEIERLEEEKREIDDRLAELDDLDERLPELEERRRSLQDEIEDRRTGLAEVNERIQSAETDIEQSRDQQSEFEATLEQLQETRAEREDVTYRIETERESIDSLRSERDELEADLEDFPEHSAAERDSIDRELERLRREKESIDSLITQLQNVIQFNEGVLDDEGSELQALMFEDDDGAITDQLVDDGSRRCWTCGSTVDADTIESNVAQLRTLRDEQVNRLNELNDEIDELTSRKREIERTRDERERLQERLESVRDEIDRRRTNLDALEEQLAELDDRIAELEREAESLDTGDHGDVIDLHRRASELEVEIEQLSEERAEIEAEIDGIDEQREERSELHQRREDVATSLSEQRSRIDEIEADAVEAFNEPMAELLTLLEYDNIDRIWIERTTEEIREGRQTVTKNTFDLHIVRSSEDGSVYEDRVENLSESEREVTGIVFALAGYLVHEIYETVPFLLLDSLEAIDSQRIADLLDYVSVQTDYLVVALLPEDAAAQDEDQVNRIEEI